MPNRGRNLLNRARGHGSGFLNRGDYATVLLEPFFAAHQHKYMPGTSGYRALWSAIDQVIGGLLGKQPPKNPSRFVAKYRFGRRSRRNIEAVGNPYFTQVMNEAIKITHQDFSVMGGGVIAPYRPNPGAHEEVLRALTEAVKRVRP